MPGLQGYCRALFDNGFVTERLTCLGNKLSLLLKGATLGDEIAPTKFRAKIITSKKSAVLQRPSVGFGIVLKIAAFLENI